jgi:hypothetical protein
VTINCGSADHDDACTCDVVVLTTAPTNYRPNEVWLAGMIQRATGIDPMKGSTEFAEFYEAVTKAYDASRRVADVDDKLPDVTINRDRILAWIRSGESIVDAPAEFDMDLTTVVRYLTFNKASKLWLWDELDWIAAEALLQADECESGEKAVGKALGLTQGVARTLIRAYCPKVTNLESVA